jgi:hypothetical protein
LDNPNFITFSICLNAPATRRSLFSQDRSRSSLTAKSINSRTPSLFKRASNLFVEHRGISLKIGERVQVSMSSQNDLDENPHFHLKAKVISKRKFDDNVRSPARGVGLQFID